LPDLVQMECLSGSRRTFRITSGRLVGYLAFDTGRIAAAITGEEEGERAVLEILRWQSGTFEPWADPLPASTPITSNWQNLLLRAAQARDESGRHRLTVPRPRPAAERSNGERQAAERAAAGRPTPPRAERASAPPPSSAPASGTHTVPGSTTPAAPLGAGAQAGVSPAVRGYVLLDGEGNLAQHAGDGETLTPIVAYGARLADLIGDALGLDGMSAMEWSTPEGRYFIHREANGQLVALDLAPESDLRSVRQRFGL
jgi:hypothetical protein